MVAGVALLAAFGGGPAAKAATPSPVLDWTTLATTPAPPPVAYAAAAYDPALAEVVLFGGITAGGQVTADTWIFNGSGWAKAAAAQSPPARDLASMAYDPASGRLILFGGYGGDKGLLDDTWAWNGASWVELDAGAPAPGPRDGAALAHDKSGGLILFGGTGPADQGGPTASTVLDTVPPQQVSALSDTWRWTIAGGWVQDKVPGPPARAGAVMTYDPQNGTTVLFGGEPTPAAASRALGDTWVWSGSAWSEAKPATSPSPRFGAEADYFTGVGGPLMFGGEGPSGALADAWAWNGATWVQAEVQGPATARDGAAGAYDPATQKMVVFGGTGGGVSTLGDTGALSLVPAKPAPPTTTPKAPTTTTVAKPTPGTTRTAPTTAPSTTTSHPTLPHQSSTTLPQGYRVGLPMPPVLRAGQQEVQQGASVQLSGAGFAPGSVVTLSFHSQAATLGTAVVAPNGTFSKVVKVPAGATPGEHHFAATGTSTTGKKADLSAAVTVVVAHHKRTSTVTTLSLVGLAVLIPVTAYLGMAGVGMWRRRMRRGV